MKVYPFLLFFIVALVFTPFTFSGEGGVIQPLEVNLQGSQEYRISPGDLLEISVFEVEELSKTVRVGYQGFISLPLIGFVKVEGFTLKELTERLEGLLEEKYLQFPQVSVFVKEAGSFYVLGKVNEGGVFPYKPAITLSQAIATAGGFKEEEADLKEIRITRSLKEGKHSFTVDYTGIMKGEVQDIPIMKDDVIFVRGLGKFYVGGYVNKPGAFDYRIGMTLQQAIASAGDISDIGKASRVQIRRKGKDGGVEVFTVNYDRVRAGDADDIEIREGDIIYIPRSYVMGFVRAFFFTLGLGDRHSVGVNPTPVITGR